METRQLWNPWSHDRRCTLIFYELHRDYPQKRIPYEVLANVDDFCAQAQKLGIYGTEEIDYFCRIQSKTPSDLDKFDVGPFAKQREIEQANKARGISIYFRTYSEDEAYRVIQNARFDPPQFWFQCCQAVVPIERYEAGLAYERLSKALAVLRSEGDPARSPAAHQLQARSLEGCDLPWILRMARERLERDVATMYRLNDKMSEIAKSWRACFPQQNETRVQPVYYDHINRLKTRVADRLNDSTTFYLRVLNCVPPAPPRQSTLVNEEPHTNFRANPWYASQGDTAKNLDSQGNSSEDTSESGSDSGSDWSHPPWVFRPTEDFSQY